MNFECYIVLYILPNKIPFLLRLLPLAYNALNSQQLDGKTCDMFLQLSGGVMIGDLFLNSDPKENLQSATKQYVDNGTYIISGQYQGTLDDKSYTLTTQKIFVGFKPRILIITQGFLSPIRYTGAIHGYIGGSALGDYIYTIDQTFSKYDCVVLKYSKDGFEVGNSGYNYSNINLASKGIEYFYVALR